MPARRIYPGGRWILALAILTMCGCPALQSRLDIIGNSKTVTAAAPYQGTVGQTDQGMAQNRPSVTGAHLNLAPGETAAERALELSRKLSAVEDEKKMLAARVQQLEAVLEERDRALVNASREVQEASEEMARTRADLQRWKQEVSHFRGKLQNSEKENFMTLQSIVTLFEQMLERDKPAETKHEASQETPLEHSKEITHP